MDAYVQSCNVCWVLKIFRYKLYVDIQFWMVLIYYWNNLSVDFEIGLLFSTKWKRDSNDAIFVIVDQHTKIVYYKPVKITIDTAGRANVIINVVVRHNGLFESIVCHQSSLFISKFSFLLQYSLGICQKLFIAFYQQTDGRTKRQNNIVKAYLCAFINCELNN